MGYPNSEKNATLQGGSTGLEAYLADRIPWMMAQTVNMPALALDVEDALRLAAWFGGAMLATVAAVYALKRWQKRLREGPKKSRGEYNDTFPLEAMDKLLADGQITPDEYRRLRRARLGLKPENQPPADSSSSPPAPDVDAQ